MLKYVSKFLLDILPSVIATVLGAYIVNHYIIPRSGSETQKAAVHSVEPANPDHADQRATDTMRKPEAAAVQDAKADPSKSKSAVEKAEKAIEKPSEKPTEKSLEAVRENPKPATEGKRWTSRERPVAKSVAPVTPAPLPTEAASVPDRDVNELARAAIERLRPSRLSREAARPNEPGLPEAREQAVGSVTPNGVAAIPQPSQPQPSQPRPFVQPLPPPVDVSTSNAVNVEGLTPAAPAAKSADANRLVPPADIPPPKPLDLQAAAGPSKPSVTDDVLSAARSVINAVVPQ